MKKFLVLAALVAMTSGIYPATASEDGIKLNAVLVDFPNYESRCGGAGTKFGLHIVGNQLFVGNQKTYRGLFETSISADGSINKEFTAIDGSRVNRLKMSGNIQTKNLILENSNAGCKWNLVFTP